jgi:hypothetical protein
VEIFGNHEYDTTNGRVTVNFKIPSSNAPKKINGKPADEALKEIFEGDYDKLFKEVPSTSVTAQADTMKAQFDAHPEIFTLRLKAGLKGDVLEKLYKQNPEVFEMGVADVEQYSKLYPVWVETSTALKVQNGFLEKLGKVEAGILARAKSFLLPFLQKVLKTAVVCGNKSKKK